MYPLMSSLVSLVLAEIFLLLVCWVALQIFCVPVVEFERVVLLLRLVVTDTFLFKKRKITHQKEKKRCAGCLAIVSGFCCFLFFNGFGGKKMKERKKLYNCTSKPAHTCDTPK